MKSYVTEHDWVKSTLAESSVRGQVLVIVCGESHTLRVVSNRAMTERYIYTITHCSALTSVNVFQQIRDFAALYKLDYFVISTFTCL